MMDRSLWCLVLLVSIWRDVSTLAEEHVHHMMSSYSPQLSGHLSTLFEMCHIIGHLLFGSPSVVTVTDTLCVFTE